MREPLPPRAHLSWRSSGPAGGGLGLGILRYGLWEGSSCFQGARAPHPWGEAESLELWGSHPS